MPSPSRSAANIDAVVQQNYPQAWGVELAIYKRGALVYQKGYGLRDRGLPEQFEGPNFWGIQQTDQLFGFPRGQFAPDAHTVFDLASVSKEFTAGAILLLQQDGKLSVTDTVAKYFPAFPNGNAITLLYL
ncbi:MAG: beta-lactamase family protein, partial [Candidatus Eremiobacteraeota bacterium]|nr:beta-lactamase family protein [Candidatus Eremiobacteraeota bacterium]